MMFPCAVAFVATALALLILHGWAPRFDLIDHPGGRRLHAAPVPLVGGIGIFTGLGIALVWLGALAPAPVALAWAAGLTVLGGIADDRHEISACAKLLVQVLAAAIVVEFGGVVLTHLGALFTAEVQGLGTTLAVPFTVLGIVGVMNAMNMIDGADGLAGGITLSALFWFGLATALAGQLAPVGLIAIAACAVAAYLAFNAWPPLARRYKVFLGDAGSLLLGLILAWLAIALSMGPFPALKPVTAVWILAVPICDSVSLMLRRVLRRRSPFTPDREHFHHLLQDLGFTTGQAVVLMLAISAAFGGIALLAERTRVPEHWMFWLSMVIFVAYTWGSARFFSRRRGVTHEV